MTVDVVCKTALAERGISYLTIPIDYKKRNSMVNKYSRHNV
jgi:pyruvate dehydrogenase (quinone)